MTVSLRLPVNTSNQDDFNRRVATAVNAILALVENNSMDAIEGIYKASPPTLTDGDQSEILLDSLGRLRVVQGGGVVGMEPSRATYVANFTGYAGYANMTDILRLSGSDTKTVAVTALWLIFQATAANNFTTNVDIIKRTAANTGGTPAAIGPTQNDSADSAATAAFVSYGAAPSGLGTSTAPGGGVLRRVINPSYNVIAGVPTFKLGLDGMSTANLNPPAQSAGDLRKPIILRGSAEGLCVNMNTVALPSGFVVHGGCEWIEF